MEDDDELLDLVTADDQVIGTIARGDYNRVVRENLGYLRAVDILQVNSKGELWTPKRTPYKTIAPNGLDYSCGGHVGSGETYVESALREIEEELQIKISAEDLEFIKMFRYDDLHYINAVYLYHSDEVPHYNPDDFVSWEWLTPKALLEKLDSGVPAKTSIRPTVAELLQLGVLK